MKAVVTGATGHLGANLVRELLARGDRVRALVHGTDPQALAGLDLERVPGDVLQRDSLERAFDGAEVVFHLAGVISIDGDPDGRVRAVNVEGVDNAARAALARGVRRFVHVSSVHAFDLRRNGRPVCERTTRCTVAPEASSAYGLSKAAGERRVRRAVDEGLDAVIVHPTGIIGPWDFRPSRMGQVFLDLCGRRLPGLVAGGFDFVDARDVARGLVAAAERGRKNESYLLPGRYLRVTELAEIAARVTGVRPPRLTSPMWLARSTAPLMRLAARVAGAEPLYTRESLQALRENADVDGTKARTELGFTARPTEASVRDAYRWFAEHGRIPRDAVREPPA